MIKPCFQLDLPLFLYMKGSSSQTSPFACLQIHCEFCCSGYLCPACLCQTLLFLLTSLQHLWSFKFSPSFKAQLKLYSVWVLLIWGIILAATELHPSLPFNPSPLYINPKSVISHLNVPPGIQQPLSGCLLCAGAVRLAWVIMDSGSLPAATQASAVPTWLQLWWWSLIDTRQSSNSQAWQEVPSIHSSTILQAPLASSE